MQTISNQKTTLHEVPAGGQLVTGAGVVALVVAELDADIDLHDGTSAAGTKIATIKYSIASHAQPWPAGFMPEFSVGLFAVVTGGSAQVYTA